MTSRVPGPDTSVARIRREYPSENCLCGEPKNNHRCEAFNGRIVSYRRLKHGEKESVEERRTVKETNRQ